MSKGIVQHIDNAARFQSEVPIPHDNTAATDIALNIANRQSDPSSRPPEAKPQERPAPKPAVPSYPAY